MIDNPTKQKQQSDLTVKRKQGDLTIDKQKSRQGGGASEIAAFVRRTQALQAATRLQQGRLIFALDATASRQQTWNAACEIQNEMFNEVAGLNVQLVYYRGLTECRASAWIASGDRLAGLMQKIRCMSGATQIGKVLSHARSETDKHKVAALVFVGDCLEESLDDLTAIARELGARGVPVFNVPGRRRSRSRAGIPRDRSTEPRSPLPVQCGCCSSTGTIASRCCSLCGWWAQGLGGTARGSETARTVTTPLMNGRRHEAGSASVPGFLDPRPPVGCPALPSRSPLVRFPLGPTPHLPMTVLG